MFKWNKIELQHINIKNETEFCLLAIKKIRQTIRTAIILHWRTSDEGKEYEQMKIENERKIKMGKICTTFIDNLSLLLRRVDADKIDKNGRHIKI